MDPRAVKTEKASSSILSPPIKLQLLTHNNINPQKSHFQRIAGETDQNELDAGSRRTSQF